MRRNLLPILLVVAINLCAQESGDSPAMMKQILERLNSLEQENKQLMQDVKSLREELAASRPANEAKATANENKPDQPTIEERLSVEEQRTAEQAQTKVEAAHKFPIRLDGMLLFNAFTNSSGNAAEYYPENYSLLTGPVRDGATVRQTLLGLDFDGPHLPGGGRVSGFLTMDFFGANPDPQDFHLRLRRAGISFDWANRTVFVGQDKPLISPYQPDSLAEVGVPPLAGAGNLWLWLPQVRYEERLHLAKNSGIKAQVSVLETEETYTNAPSIVAPTLAPARPALEGRVAFWHNFDDTRKLEFAPGFHVSTTHVGGASVDSRVGSFDWLFIPASFLQFSGTIYTGQNVAGLGALGNGFTVTRNHGIQPVHSTGGWAQVAFPITSRLTFNVFSGIENDRSPFFYSTNIVHNWTYASNLMYHVGPNVVVSLEALQMRTRSFLDVGALQNHYDLAVGYLF
ncbi:MAG TPA: hypothetical protein VFA65_14075 [Bryobacteraceae bacterium]|nr:hypothetical protein [Bryobacteraceae bacterium]